MEKQHLLADDPGNGEAYELYGTVESPPPPPPSALRGDHTTRLAGQLFRLLFIASCISFGLYYLVTRAPFGRINVPSPFRSIGPIYSDSVYYCSTGDVEFPPLGSIDKRVPLEAHIMSKCPDARDCLQQLIVPAMEQVDDLVDFRLSFIAR